MKCPKCGSEQDAAARFCGVCGNKMLAPAAAQPGGGPALAQQPAATKPLAPQPAAAARPMAQPAMGTPPAPRAPQGSSQVPRQPAAPSPAPAQTASVAPKGNNFINPGTNPGKDPFIGQVLNGRYRVETKLGQGGFGAVYKGKHDLTGREVALKVLHPDMARDANLVARFRREGAVACNLRDAHTVTTYDFDQTPDGTLYIAMEMLTGRSLHDIFYDEAPLPWRRVLRVLEQMCSSLGEAHRQGIVHRDIKPENIYLEDRPGQADYVKVLDFGIAKIIRGDIGGTGPGGSMPQLTATGQTLGTLEYMSPEQLMGKQLDGRSDIYAMGVLSFELITGHLPFPDANGPAELIGAQLKKAPPVPSAANPSGEIPPGVDAIILKMLEKDRSRRYQNVDELAGDIVPVLASNGRQTGPSMAMSSGVTPPPVLLDGPTIPPSGLSSQVSAQGGSIAPRGYQLAPPTEENPAANPNRFMIWLVVALLLVAGALAGVYFGVIRKSSAEPPPAPAPTAPNR
jgi:eukaryotic-like serine/threonine-protein kinase